MELGNDLFNQTLLNWIWAIYALVLLNAVRLAAWRRVFRSSLLHVFLGSCIAMALLWSVKANVNDNLSFHLLGVTAMTLVFGWSLGVIGSGLTLIMVTFNGAGGWEVFAVNAILLGVLPATLTQFSLVLVRSLLPKNFFIYVLINGFLTAGLVAMICGYCAVGLMLLSDQYTWMQMKETFVPFFPLMFMPEAFLNGWIITILVLYRPHWVYSFSDEQYIKGK